MKYIFSLLLCLNSIFSWGQQDKPSWREYASQINAVQTLQSNFTEEKHLSLLNKPIQSEGTFFFSKNAQKLRWQYQKPFENGFLIEKDSVYRLQKSNKKPVDSSMGRMFIAEMLLWLTLDFDALQNNYQIELNESEITFIPYKKHKIVKQITIWLNAKDVRLVTQVKMEEQNGDFVLWKFHNTTINPYLSDEVFQ